MCSVDTPFSCLSFISVHENAANIKDLDKKRTISDNFGVHHAIAGKTPC